jgi:hypothetical protein
MFEVWSEVKLAKKKAEVHVWVISELERTMALIPLHH